MTFKELYVSGQIEFEEIDRYISRWNRSDDERTLAKYLGLNAKEEDVWIDESDEALKELLDSYEKVKGTPVTLGRTGIIVNKWLNLGIWDYSNVPFQLFGQICLPFMALFGLLCTIGIYLGGYLLHVLYGEEKPKIPIW